MRNPMELIRTRVVYYNKKGEQHTLKLEVYMYPDQFINGDKINWKGVNDVTAEVDNPDNPTKYVIFQAGGWTSRRGLFVDYYNETGKVIEC